MRALQVTLPGDLHINYPALALAAKVCKLASPSWCHTLPVTNSPNAKHNNFEWHEGHRIARNAICEMQLWHAKMQAASQSASAADAVCHDHARWFNMLTQAFSSLTHHAMRAAHLEVTEQLWESSLHLLCDSEMLRSSPCFGWLAAAALARSQSFHYLVNQNFQVRMFSLGCVHCHAHPTCLKS